MICAQKISDTEYFVFMPQPTEFKDCVFIIAQPNELPTDFMNMTSVEGLYVGGLLAALLAVGFSFRAIGRALFINEKGDKDE